MSTDLDYIYERLDNCEGSVDDLRERLARIEEILRDAEVDSDDAGW